MLFIHPDSRNTFAPHCNEAFTVGRARHHYRLLEFYVPSTRGYRISGTFRLDPTHWKLPVILEQDKTVVAHNHKFNAAEPAVKTAKYHIIAHVATLDHQCPIQLWSKIMPKM